MEQWSRLLRWDPHIHAPRTLLSDHFAGDWAGYFSAIGSAISRVAAPGITDYFTLRAYKEFQDRRPSGAFPWVELVFPNVELRSDSATSDP